MDLFDEIERRGKLLVDDLYRMEQTAVTEKARREALLGRIEERYESFREVTHETLMPLFLDSEFGRAITAKARDQDNEITHRFESLRQIPLDDETFEPQFRVVDAIMRDHVRVIEKEIFPEAKRRIPGDHAQELLQTVNGRNGGEIP
jgi:hypothetical protein